MTSTEQQAPSKAAPKATVSVEPREERTVPLRVENMDAQPDGFGRKFVPDHAVISYWRYLGYDWQVYVTVNGPRVLANGTVSPRSRAGRAYFMPGDCDPEAFPTRPVAPKFLQDIVEHYWPAGVPRVTWVEVTTDAGDHVRLQLDPMPTETDRTVSAQELRGPETDR